MFEKGKYVKPVSLLVLGWAGVNAILAMITMYYGLFQMVDYFRESYVVAFFMGFAKLIVYAAFILVAIMGLKKKIKVANLISFILIAVLIIWVSIQFYVNVWGSFAVFQGILGALSVELVVAIAYSLFLNKSTEE